MLFCNFLSLSLYIKQFCVPAVVAFGFSGFIAPASGGRSLFPLGGGFWRRGTPKLVEQRASYSEGYKRYPNGGR